MLSASFPHATNASATIKRIFPVISTMLSTTCFSSSDNVAYTDFGDDEGAADEEEEEEEVEVEGDGEGEEDEEEDDVVDDGDDEVEAEAEAEGWLVDGWGCELAAGVAV